MTPTLCSNKAQIETDAEVRADGRITEVSLLRTVEGGTTIYGGTLRLKGIGIWALRCEGAVGARL